jgi:hypothetical protein
MLPIFSDDFLINLSSLLIKMILKQVPQRLKDYLHTIHACRGLSLIVIMKTIHIWVNFSKIPKIILCYLVILDLSSFLYFKIFRNFQVWRNIRRGNGKTRFSKPHAAYSFLFLYIRLLSRFNDYKIPMTK